MANDNLVNPESPDVVEFGNEQNVSAVVPEPRPWPFWPTVGFSAIIVVVYLVVCAVITVVFIIGAKVGGSQATIDHICESLSENGLLMAVSTIATTPAVIGLCVLFAFLRKSIAVRDYLAIRWVSRRQLFTWLGAIAGFMIASDGLTLLLGRDVVPEFMVNVYATSVFPSLLLFAVIVCAPLAEECFFRGFLFKGLVNSWMGPVGATIATALLWAVMHLQYDVYGITSIFVLGLLLAAARIRTKSILMPIIMHMAMNAVASIELLITQLQE